MTSDHQCEALSKATVTVTEKMIKVNKICTRHMMWKVKIGPKSLQTVFEDFKIQTIEPQSITLVILNKLETLSRMWFHEGQVSSWSGLFWRICHVYCLGVQNSVFLCLTELNISEEGEEEKVNPYFVSVLKLLLYPN